LFFGIVYQLEGTKPIAVGVEFINYFADDFALTPIKVIFAGWCVVIIRKLGRNLVLLGRLYITI